jgi:hypothetical protein
LIVDGLLVMSHNFHSIVIIVPLHISIFRVLKKLIASLGAKLRNRCRRFERQTIPHCMAHWCGIAHDHAEIDAAT